MATDEGVIAAFQLLSSAKLGNEPKETADKEACLELWYEVFDDVDDAALRMAARRYLKTGKWWPAPADLYNLTAQGREAQAEARQLAEDDGLHLWPRIVRLVGSLGTQRYPNDPTNNQRCSRAIAILAQEYQLDERQTAAAEQALQGFWSDVAHADSDARIGWLGKQFSRVYRSIQNSDTRLQLESKPEPKVIELADVAARRLK